MISRRVYSLDFLRFCCACLVVGIHSQVFYDINTPIADLVNLAFGRLAVPFFACVTGYFIAEAKYAGKQIRGRQVLSLIKIYGKLSILYLIWEWVNLQFQGMAPGEIIYTIIKRTFIYGNYYHLWFFPGMIWMLILIGIAERVHLSKLLKVFSVLSYIVAVFTYTWYGLGRQCFPQLDILMEWFDFDYICRFLGIILPFVLLGGIIQQTKEYWLEKVPVKKLFMAVVFSILIYILEIELALWTKSINRTSASFTAPVVIYFLFMLALRYPGTSKTAGVFFRKASVIMYGLHPILLEIGKKLSDGLLSEMNTLLWFSCVAIICLCTSITLKLKGRKTRWFLKKKN